MGSFIELNDTLQITTEQGFPADVFDLDKHRKCPIRTEDVKGRIFSFHNKPKARLYHQPPVRVYLAHNINGKWLFWGRILIVRQTIEQRGDEFFTSGDYIFERVYDPQYQEVFTRNESPPGKSYFPGNLGVNP